MSSENSSQSDGARRTIQSVDRAVAIVEALAAAKADLSLAELATALRVPPQTAQGLVRTLQWHGWVAQAEPRGRYRLGSRLGELHRGWRRGQDRAALARPIVADLSRRLREYVVLAEWAGSGLRPLVEANPDRELTVRGELFLPDRIHAMATGKLLLAMLEEPARSRAVAALPLGRRGPNSVTDRAALLDQLRAIEAAGIAFCLEEAAEGVAAVSVPVAADAGGASALGVSLPLVRCSPAHHAELVGALRAAAAAIADAWA